MVIVIFLIFPRYKPIYFIKVIKKMRITNVTVSILPNLGLTTQDTLC